MKTFDFEETITSFRELIEQNDVLNKKIKSVILGGSVVYNKLKVISDIDILVITDNCFSNKILQLFKEIEKKETTLSKQMDIKILEEMDIQRINQSLDALFLFDFIKNSSILFGQDFRDTFKISMQTKYNILQNSLDEIYKIKEIYPYPKYTNFASIILFDITKKLIIMQKNISSSLQSTSDDNKEELKSFFRNYYQKLNNLTKRHRKWISVYSRKGEKEEWGFTLLKASDFKNSKIKPIIPNEEFEIFITKAIDLVYDCLNLCEF